MDRIDRLRSAEAEKWERYMSLGDQRFASYPAPQHIVDAHNEAEREWAKVNYIMSLREQKIGAHADLSRDVDEGERRDVRDHRFGGRACNRACGVPRWYSPDGDYRIKVGKR